MMGIDDYIKAPCRHSALPYWKDKLFVKADSMEIYHQEEWEILPASDKDSFKKVDRFFRIINRLDGVQPPYLDDGYSIRTFDRRDRVDFQYAVDIIRRSYDNISMNEDILKSYLDTEVYREDLWVFVESKLEGRPIAFGIADLDEYVNEGILEWIQVLPDHRGKGIGKAMVSELLNRMKGQSDFVTVSGDMNNLSSPINLYKRVGFKGGDIWYICYR